MKKLISIIFIVCAVFATAQQIDTKTILHGRKRGTESVKKHMQAYLNSRCLQLNAAKFLFAESYGLLDLENNGYKRGVYGLNKVLTWGELAEDEHGCTIADWENFINYFEINLKNKK